MELRSLKIPLSGPVASNTAFGVSALGFTYLGTSTSLIDDINLSGCPLYRISYVPGLTEISVLSEGHSVHSSSFLSLYSRLLLEDISLILPFPFHVSGAIPHAFGELCVFLSVIVILASTLPIGVPAIIILLLSNDFI